MCESMNETINDYKFNSDIIKFHVLYNGTKYLNIRFSVKVNFMLISGTHKCYFRIEKSKLHDTEI